MQQRISNKIQLGNTLNPALDCSGVPAIANEANLESIYGKIDKIGGFWKSGKADESLARYIPNLYFQQLDEIKLQVLKSVCLSNLFGQEKFRLDY